MFGQLVTVAFLGLLLWWAAKSELWSFSLMMLSRIFVSGRRRPPPAVLRQGGLADLPARLATLLQRGRELTAAIADLRTLLPAYHRTFEERVTSVLDDRRHHAVRRDFEDAVIQVTRALEAWCTAQSRLDAPSRARLGHAGPLPDARTLLERFPWLPREVHHVGHLHFRTDEPAFERQLLQLDVELGQLDDALTHDRCATYR